MSNHGNILIRIGAPFLQKKKSEKILDRKIFTKEKYKSGVCRSRNVAAHKNLLFHLFVYLFVLHICKEECNLQ